MKITVQIELDLPTKTLDEAIDAVEYALTRYATVKHIEESFERTVAAQALPEQPEPGKPSRADFMELASFHEKWANLLEAAKVTYRAGADS